LDEVFLKINGRSHFLWRAVDQDGDVLDILVQSKRNKKAAKKFIRKLLKGLRYVPRVIITDKLKSYSAAKAESNAERRTHSAEVSKQPRGEFASTDKIERESDEAVQVSGPCPTIPLCLWTDLITIQRRKTSLLGQWLSDSEGAQIRVLRSSHCRPESSMTTAIVDR